MQTKTSSKKASSSSSSNPKVFPRKLLVQILGEVLSQGHALDQTLDQAFARNEKLSVEHRAWLKEVASGTLRWKGRLDAAIDQAAFKKKPTGRLRRILLAAAYGVVVQDRVASARVVDEWVGFIRELEGVPPSRFANAVLRRISETAAAWRDWEFPEGATVTEKARWASLPEWFWARLVAERGEAWAREYAVASLERPRLWLRAKPGTGDGARPAGLERSSENLPAGAWERASGGGPVTDLPGFSTGDWLVQDVSSQVLIEAVTRAMVGAAGVGRPRAWDFCAAPGGKSVGLAWNGFEVRATDKPGQRLMLLQETVRRCDGEGRVSVEPIPASSLAAPAGTPAWDLVWVDAPCSGSGILRRHPDVRWLRKAEDVESLRKLQREILIDAWKSVRDGGYLAYSVCSVFPSELASLSEAIDSKEFREVARWDLSPQQAPHGDGFQCALLQRTASRSRIS